MLRANTGFSYKSCSLYHILLQCYSVDELLSIVGATEGLTRQGLLDVCPAILQQTVRGACREEDHHDDPPTSTYTKAQSKVLCN